MANYRCAQVTMTWAGRRGDVMTKWIVVSLLVGFCGVSGCTSEPEEPVIDSTPELETSAGSILRVDPALDAIVPVDARIEKLHAGFAFTEGPVWVQQPSPHLLFSDVRGNAIYKWTPDGELTDFMNPVFDGEGPSVGSNGLTLDPDGRLILMEHGNRQVTRIESDGTHTVLVDRYEGKRLNSPNDGIYSADGWLYFTDPPYGLPQQDEDPAKELDFSGIYRLSPAGNLELLNREQTRPNGIAFSPDGSTLYVANSDAEHKVWMAYNVMDDGSLDSGRIFFDVTAETDPGSPDGLKVDQEGHVFATGPGGVWVLDPTGKHLGTIQPNEVPANVAWGNDGRTLYMTARTGLYRVALTTQGLMP